MFNIPFQREKNITTFQEILEKGQLLYAISEENDRKCLEMNNIENWADIFYNLKKGIFKERYIELMSRTENNKFFEALNYEYGINNYPLDLNKAFQIYKFASDTSNDCLSMYRLYHIYKNEYKKFNISKRNVILEKYYFFKCCTYLPYDEIVGNIYLFKRINIIGELKIILEDDPILDELDKFFDYLKQYYKFFNFKFTELTLIHSVVKLIYTDGEDNDSYHILLGLSKQNHLEAIYKLLCLCDSTSKKKCLYQILYQKNYYRSFLRIALYLNSQENKELALKVLKMAIKNGYYSFINYYFVIFFETNDFESIMNSPILRNELLFIIGCIIDSLIADDFFYFFEFLYMRHICIKYFNFEKEFKEYFLDYTKEIVDYLIAITKGTEEENKEIKRKYFLNSNSYWELNFACGILFFYGIEGIKNRDYNISLEKLTKSYNNTEVEGDKRYYYTYIYKIKERLLKNNKNNNLENDIDNAKEFLKIKNTLFDMYYKKIYDSNADYLSSSFFYYLSKLYQKKVGNNGDILFEFIFMKKAANFDSKGKKLILNSFNIYYKKYKAKIKMKDKDTDEYYENLKNIRGYISIEGYGEDGTICPICFDKKKTTTFLPCKHFFCPDCTKKLIINKKCPICRTIIIITFDIESKQENFISSNK